MNNPRKFAAAAIAGTGLIHLILTPEYMGEQPYIGVLFLIGAGACAWVAARLWRGHDVRAWLLGAVTAAGMFAGFVLSRTVGLPGFHESEWEASGLLTLLLEAGFLGAALLSLRRAPGRFARTAMSGSATTVR